MITDDSTSRWKSAWPDVLAFALGLGVAYAASWKTTDLVWSLWLSSLVVGYATILWTTFRPGLHFALLMRKGDPLDSEVPVAALVIGGLAFGIFMIAFFTVHFGGFHYVHSQFLHGFFPITATTSQHTPANLDVYAEVFRRYWHFLPAAFIAERAGFRWSDPMFPDGSLRMPDVRGRKDAGAMMGPYKNVIRMHFLIFFFVFVHAIGLDHFAVYAVVYAVYFFPFRLLRRARADAAPVES